MAVRIQFRRGTAAEWASANPILAAGELGYESDTGSFKIGNATSNWNALAYGAISQSYVENALADVVGLAPETLDTLAELAASIGGDANFGNTVTAGLATLDAHLADATNVHGIADTEQLETKTGAQDKANAAQANAASYTDTAVANLVDSAPGTLNTLNELAAALSDDPNFATTIATSLGGKISFVIDTAANFATANVLTTANTLYIESDHAGFVRVGDGVTHYNSLDFVGKSYADNLMNDHENLDTNVHGISNTANLAYQTDIANALGATSDVANTLSSHEALTSGVHGIASVADLVVTAGLNSAINTHNSDTTNVHGIANTAELVTTTILAAHSDDTINVHGIADTSTLVVASDLDAYAQLDSPSFTGTVALPSTTSIGDVSGTELSYVNGVTGGIQTQLDAKLDASTASTTYVAVQGGYVSNLIAIGTTTLDYATSIGQVSADEISTLNGVTSSIQDQIDAKAPIASPTFTGTVSGVTKAMVGLGDVNNTSDAAKPISDDTQAALDLKADLSGATFNGDVVVTGDFTVTGTTTTVNTANFTTTDPLIYLGEGNAGNTADLGFVANFNDGTYQHAGLVRDSSAGTWKLFKGVTDEPGTTVNFGQGTMDDLAVKNLTADGVVFSDGTQTKVGVPSISAFTYKTASYTLDALTLRDGIIEVSSASATTITIPADSSVNYPVGSSIDILQTNTGQVTIAGANGVTVNSTPGLKLRTRWSSATLLKRAADTWIVYGDLTA